MKPCQNLGTLHFTNDNFKFQMDEGDVSFVQKILTKFTGLNHLDGIDTIQAVNELCSTDRNFKTNLKNILVQNGDDDRNYTPNDNLDDMIKTQLSAMTTVNRCTILRYKGETLSSLTQMEPSLNVLEVIVWCLNNNHISYLGPISNVLKCHGPALTTLYLSRLRQVNVLEIVANCPHLVHLILEIFPTYGNYATPVAPLEHIESLTIMHVRDHENFIMMGNIPAESWIALLANASKLQHIHIQGYDCTGLKSVLAHAYSKHDFKQLQSLVLVICRGIKIPDLLPIMERVGPRGLSLSCDAISQEEIEAWRKTRYDNMQ